jgi:RNA polymerase I-specific transcription initiation factor RRN7
MADHEKEAADNDLVKLLSGLSDASSDSEGSQSDDKHAKPLPHTKGNQSKFRIAQPYNTPLSNIAVLVTACWMMRIPVIYMDFVG